MKLRKSQNKLVLILILTTLFTQTGCSSMGKSVSLGSAIGAGTGAALGGIIGKDGKHRTRNVIIGAGVGAVAGGFAGSAIHENHKRDKQLSYLQGKEAERKSLKGKATPSLQEPRVEAIWVENKIIGNRYIEGHYEYIITEPTRWETP